MHPLVTEARQLDAKARAHKREAARQRDAAKACRTRQAEIERQCARLGIDVTYASPGQPAGDVPHNGTGDPHGQRPASRPRRAR